MAYEANISHFGGFSVEQEPYCRGVKACYIYLYICETNFIKTRERKRFWCVINIYLVFFAKKKRKKKQPKWNSTAVERRSESERETNAKPINCCADVIYGNYIFFIVSGLFLLFSHSEYWKEKPLLDGEKERKNTENCSHYSVFSSHRLLLKFILTRLV